jgi:hypothetical protein
MSAEDWKTKFEVVRGRPVPKEFLTMFNISYANRLFVTVTDKNDVWQDDLAIAERIFGSMVLMPVAMDKEALEKEWALTGDVLKQRMKYPGVKEDPKLLQLAKTWVLPTKLSKMEQNDTVLTLSADDFADPFKSLFEQLKVEEQKIHVLKIELQKGLERQFVYKFLDAGFRPSVLLVKWTEDLDDNVSTAHCAGHLMNSGYALVNLEGQYALYMFRDQVLYDICSMKTVDLKNPMIESLLESVSVLSAPPPLSEEDAPAPTS